MLNFRNLDLYIYLFILFRHSWDQKAKYCVHRNPLLNHILNQINRVHVFSVDCFNVHFNIILRPTRNSSKSSFRPSFTDQISSTHATSSTYFIFLVSNIVIIFNEVFKIINLVFIHFSSTFWHFPPLISKYSRSHPVLKHRQTMFVA
jgi:hypothetical protein